MRTVELTGWDHLRHGGLLLDPQRLGEIAAHEPGPLSPYIENELRRRSTRSSFHRRGSYGAAIFS